MKKIIALFFILGIINQLEACGFSILHCFGICRNSRVERFEQDAAREAEHTAPATDEKTMNAKHLATTATTEDLAAIKEKVVAQKEETADIHEKSMLKRLSAYDLCSVCKKAYAPADKIFFLSCGHHMCSQHFRERKILTHASTSCPTPHQVSFSVLASRLIKYPPTMPLSGYVQTEMVSPHSVSLLLGKFKNQPDIYTCFRQAIKTNILDLSKTAINNTELMIIVSLIHALGLNETLDKIILSDKQLTFKAAKQLTKENFRPLMPLQEIIHSEDIPGAAAEA